MIILVLVWCKLIYFWLTWAENDFHIFIHSDLDLWSLELKFAPLVTLVHHYVSTKLEVSTAFLLWENWRQGTDGQTDGRGAKNVIPRDAAAEQNSQIISW